MSTLMDYVTLVEETRDSSKQALIDKGVELDDSYKLSQVDEKIAKIQSGGGDGFYFIENFKVTYYGREYRPSNSTYYVFHDTYQLTGYLTIEFKVKDDISPFDTDLSFSAHGLNESSLSLKPGQTYSFEAGSGSQANFSIQGSKEYEIYYYDRFSIECTP